MLYDYYIVIFLNQKTAYELRISDWNSDVCSSDQGDPGLIEAEEAAVRYRNAVGVARQIGEHRLGPGERRLGIDHPALLPDGREVPQECAPLGELGHAAAEGALPLVLEGAHAGGETPAEQGGNGRGAGRGKGGEK